MEDIKCCDRVYELCPECTKRAILWIETPVMIVFNSVILMIPKGGVNW